MSPERLKYLRSLVPGANQAALESAVLELSREVIRLEGELLVHQALIGEQSERLRDRADRMTAPPSRELYEALIGLTVTDRVMARRVKRACLSNGGLPEAEPVQPERARG